jgi:PST family polysaccharide transporter
VLARLLTPHDFGIVGAALIVANLAQIFSELGVAPAIIQRRELDERHIGSGFALSLLLGVSAFVAVLLGSTAIAALFRQPELEFVVRAYSALFVVKGLSVTAEALLQRELKFQLLAGLDIATFAIGYAVVAMVLAFCGFGFWSLVAAHISRSALYAIGLVLVRKHPKYLRPRRQESLQLLRFGAGFTLSRMGVYGANEGDKAIVAQSLGAEAMGEYGRAYQLVVMPINMLGRLVDNVMFPSLAEIQAQPERLRTVYRRMLTTAMLISAPLACAGAIAADATVRTVLGPGWEGVTLILQIMAFSIVFRALSKACDSLAKSTGAVYRRALIQWVFVAVVLAGGIFGAQWGTAGVAAAVLIATAVHAILMLRLAGALCGFSMAEFLRIAMLGAGVAAATGAFALAGRWFGDSLHLAAPAMLALIFGMAFAAFATIFTVRKGQLVGSDGQWIMNALNGMIRTKWRRR